MSQSVLKCFGLTRISKIILFNKTSPLLAMATLFALLYLYLYDFFWHGFYLFKNT